MLVINYILLKGGISINKKLKNKLILFVILFFVCLFTSLFISTYIFSQLSEIQTTWMYYLPHIILISIIKNQLHAMIFLSVSMVFLLILIMIMNNSSGNDFASELDEIAGNIKTPKKIGQAQHGSARWLSATEQDKIFTSYVIDKDNNPELNKLLKIGETQIKEVQDYQKNSIQ